MEYNKRIKIFYHPSMAVQRRVGASRSPEKPRLLLSYLNEKGLLNEYFEKESGFPPFGPEQFYLAHTRIYVDSFFTGRMPLAESNGLTWSKELATSVKYTNSSLYHAILEALANPSQITFAPVSGFHHATPYAGRSFTSMSGQVIASVKIYREFGVSGAYLDLDGHYGNSIEDSRAFNPDVNLAIPEGFNFNPIGKENKYIDSLRSFLIKLEKAVCKFKLLSEVS